MWLTIWTALCALGAVTCSIAVMWLVVQNRRGHEMLRAAINGIGETHRLSLDLMNLDIDKLKARVTALEPQ